MEIYIPDESPLASYLEGRGEGLTSTIHDEQHDNDAPPRRRNEYAPTSAAHTPRPGNHSRRRSFTFATKPLLRLRNAYAYVVASTLGNADNNRFLEHFRYILIASQLLNEHIPACSLPASSQPPPASTAYGPAAVSLPGAAISATLAFALVWLLDWARGQDHILQPNRIAIVLSVLLLAALLTYGYIRRQWLQHLRHHALSTCADFVSNAQAFEATSASTLAMIQEVELVSRGYHISSPLPPISRLENSGSARRCARLRKSLQVAYETLTPAFASALHVLRPLAKPDDLERFLDVYDIREDEISDALSTDIVTEDGDGGSLRHLRMHQTHLATLRRTVICTLLAVPATGRKEDGFRWRLAVGGMETLQNVLAEAGQRVAKLLQDEENMPNLISSPQATVPSSPRTHAKFQSQTRRISQLSTGIKSVQARLYLFRDDSNRALSSSASEPELASLSSSLREQYDAIGSDLRSLMHAWETGRKTLVDDITRQERRMIRSPSSLRSSTPSIGGLTAVDEDADVISHTSLSPRSPALGKHGGDGLLTPPITESEDEGSKDGEVFEAVSKPPVRERSTLTREERIRRMHETREQQSLIKDKRDANLNMIKELQAVINLRPSKTRRRNTVMGTTPA